MSLGTIESVEQIKQQVLDKYDYKRYPISKNPDGTYETTTDDSKPLFIDEYGVNSGLVPGREVVDGQEIYHDGIRYT